LQLLEDVGGPREQEDSQSLSESLLLLELLELEELPEVSSTGAGGICFVFRQELLAEGFEELALCGNFTLGVKERVALSEWDEKDVVPGAKMFWETMKALIPGDRISGHYLTRN
jgi:hypothetical protein